MGVLSEKDSALARALADGVQAGVQGASSVAELASVVQAHLNDAASLRSVLSESMCARDALVEDALSRAAAAEDALSAATARLADFSPPASGAVRELLAQVAALDARVSASDTAAAELCSRLHAAEDESARARASAAAAVQRAEAAELRAKAARDDTASSKRALEKEKASVLARGSSGSGGGGAGDSTELQTLRALAYCSVCSERTKNALIKCGHAFCKPCVDHLIAIRSRKCPSCGQGFAIEEVKAIFWC